MVFVHTTLKRLSGKVWPVMLLAILTLLSVWGMSNAVENHQAFSRYYLILAATNILLLGIFIIVSLYNGLQLIARIRRKEPGARLALRLSGIFMFLSLAPVLIVYIFSVRFLTQGIDSWFNVRTEQALESALHLGRVALDQKMHHYVLQAQIASQEMPNMSSESLPFALQTIRQKLNALSVTIFGENEHVLGTTQSGQNLLLLRPSSTLYQTYVEKGYAAEVEPGSGAMLKVRVLVGMPDLSHSNPSLALSPKDVLQVIFRVPSGQGQLANSIQSTYDSYRELSFTRTPLKDAFILTLTMILMLTTVSAIWGAFFFSRRLLLPIRKMIVAMRTVADGELNIQLGMSRQDEFGKMAQSFNQMTQRLRSSRLQAEISQKEIERQRRYLQTLLESLSSGVLSWDEKGCIKTVNPSAGKILGCQVDHWVGESIPALIQRHSALRSFFGKIQQELLDRQDNGQTQIDYALDGQSRILMCHLAQMPMAGSGKKEIVVVFDDVTDLMQTQRNILWSEMARRLAHEIRNPLTPIQLSVERMRLKISPLLDVDEKIFMDRAVETVIHQVDAMKRLVSDFSDFARPAPSKKEWIDLNYLIGTVIDLYRGHEFIALEWFPDSRLPRVHVDSEKIRQVIHNLLKNALEAVHRQEGSRISVTTKYIEWQHQDGVEIIVEDNGEGIMAAQAHRIFDPYVSYKSGGTGLGLAIVKKIIAEHSGRVWAEAGALGGAQFRVWLPLNNSSVSVITESDIDSQEER